MDPRIREDDQKNMSSSLQILPGILEHTPEDFQEKLFFPGFWQPGMTAHIDILDGTMFGATCFCDSVAISETTQRVVSTIPNIELHLMVQNPLPIIQHWKSLIPQTIRAIIHTEIDRPLQPILNEIKRLNLETGIALCPKTNTEIIEPFIESLDRVLIMGIEPGASGKPFLGEPILAKIRRLRALHPSLIIAVDGGVTMQNAQSIIDSGANSLIATSAIWNSEHPQNTYTQLTHSIQLHEGKRI